MKIERIMTMLEQIRAEMEQEFGEDLTGRCIIASEQIIERIKSSSIQYDTIRDVEGWCSFDDPSGCTDTPYDPHVWVELMMEGRMYYLDVTADQFNFAMDLDHKLEKIMFQEGLPDVMGYEEPDPNDWDF